MRRKKLIALGLITALSVTTLVGCNKKTDTKTSEEITSEIETATETDTEKNVQTNFTEETVDDELCVYLNSNSDSLEATERTNTLLNDGSHRLIMCGLNSSTKDLFPVAVNQYFSADNDKPIKFIDSGFVDVEKYDSFIDGVELSGSEGGYYTDSSLCWAASSCEMLWMSGWAQKITDFKSPDDIFTYYADNFINKGCDIHIGVSWLFTGENFIGDPTNYSTCLKQVTPYKPEIYGDSLIEFHDLATNGYEEIACLEQLCNNDDVTLSRTYGMSISEFVEDEIPDITLHALTPVGVIIDENATSIDDRYCAILIADSDNDSSPSEELENKENMTLEDITQDKADRLNSYTLYPLRVIQDKNGTKCWELVGYDGFFPPIIMDLVGLCSSTDEKTVSEATETEGSTDFTKDPDLFIYDIQLTSQSEPVDIIMNRHIDGIFLSKFSLKEPMNFNITYGTSNEVQPTVNPYLKVTISKDGSELYTEEIELDKDNVMCQMYNFALFELKNGAGASIEWTPGTYTATFEMNPLDENGNRRLMESYFKNNEPTVIEFEITE